MTPHDVRVHPHPHPPPSRGRGDSSPSPLAGEGGGEGADRLLNQNRIVIFAKAPVPGLVKTRLCPPLTPLQASEFYRTMACETFALARLHSDAKVEIAYEARPEFSDAHWIDGGSAVPGGLTVPGAPRMAAEGAVPFFPQGEGDLGTRLVGVFRRVFKAGAAKVVAIGCDCPHMDPRRFEEAFDALDRHDVALGPASDGGYYLIGLKKEQPSLFNAVPWSTPEVFTATMARIREADLSVGVLPVEHDIDRPADLERTWRYALPTVDQAAR